MDTYLDSYIEELLHINDGKKNKLIDLEAGDISKTYILSHRVHKTDLAEYAVGVIKSRYGKVGNTVLRGSASKDEQVVGRDVNDFEWVCADGTKDVKKLNQSIESVYSELHLKGNNPLFICVGALKWKIPVAKDEIKEVKSPLLVFPIRLTRSTATSSVHIEFVRDDAFFNPCLIAKLRQLLGEEVADSFPHPNGSCAFDEPLSLDALGNGVDYFNTVNGYVESCREADIQNQTVFEFDKNVVAIVQYNHDELCMYYDIKRNREKIYAHPLVKKVFTENLPSPKVDCTEEPLTILSCDSVQQDIIRRVYNGESMVIKGPPGTGKTQTIANMIASLISKNKKVLLASKKLSALSEVNAKLPEPLRKFVLPLFYETENQAAKVNPVNIKSDLRGVINSKKEYSFNTAVEGKRRQFYDDWVESVKFIDKYQDVMFGESGAIAGGTYYEALDAYLKNDLPEVDFAEGEKALEVTRAQYNAMSSAVEDAAAHFKIMTGNGAHPIRLCPWLGADKCENIDAAFPAYAEIAKTADKALYDASSLFNCKQEEYKNIALQTVLAVMRSPFSDGETINILSLKNDDERIEALNAAYNSVIRAEAESAGEFCVLSDTRLAEELLHSLNGKYMDTAITVDSLKAIADIIDLFYTTDGKMLSTDNICLIMDAAAKINELLARAKNHLAEVFKVFPEEICNQHGTLILDAANRFKEYTAESHSHRFMDLKAARAYRELAPYAVGEKSSFGCVVGAVKEYAEAEACAANAETINNTAAVILKRKLTSEEIEALVKIAERTACLNRKTEEYVTMAKDISVGMIELASLVNGGGNISLGKLIAGSKTAVACAKLSDAVKAITGNYPQEQIIDINKVKIAARAIEGIIALCGVQPYKFWSVADKLAAVDLLKGATEAKKETLEQFLSGIKDFGNSYFKNHYTTANKLTYGELAVFAKEADDRNVFSAAMRYFSIIHDSKNALPLNKFFKFLEKDENVVDLSFVDIFEHSFYGLAIKAAMNKMGLMRNGLGKNVRQKLDKVERSISGVNEANISVIENLCMGRINPEDKDFAFLVSERDPGETLRSLFKKYAKAILKLKSCFIITPSTASVLFRPEEYEKFDVVIVDEASQLEPVNLLPVLFRSAQCVIVGDEWQMPPIKHFETKTPVDRGSIVSESGEVAVLEPEISALTMALRNHTLPAAELVCHYRSKTESLITFSQKQFYPNMRTFPAPEPMRDGLGFVDVYVEDGRCDGGVNESEARKVVDIIREHFNRYYNEETHQLSRSLGVVAFGEKQINRIIALVERDKQLNEKKSAALAYFKDVPEKLIFFKTIETVQGQETQHLILSITYGKDKEGRIVQRFGELNRDKLGRCIFNVAVTRAQYQVTLVHSVKPIEIAGENVSYIRSYIETAERYSNLGRDQFVSEIPPKGFLRSVAKFIKSCGIDENRIVFNYGVTDGSVRMPIAILSNDLRRAVLGIWCEKPVGRKYDYFDYNMRYVRNFKDCNWNLHPINIHDWVDNAEAEREALATALKNL